MISAVVLTFNEEGILGRCLTSLSFVDEIVIFDSYSNDKTLEIAKSFNAKIVQRKFDNYAAQRNAALKQVSQHCRWILMVDADEIVTPELQNEIKSTILDDSGDVMYRVRRKDMFQEQWIKYASGYPTWFPRLFKNGCVTVAREINEEYLTSGSEGRLQEHLIHFPFNKGLTWWFDKHNRYSLMEAEQIITEIKEPINFNQLFSRDPVARRKVQKRLSYHLPFRSKMIFLAFYIFKGGFLNGKAGLTFCKLRMTYEWMITLKLKELKLKQKE